MLEEEELKDAVLVVLANKQDIEGAMSVTEVHSALGLDKLKNRTFQIFKVTLWGFHGSFNFLRDLKYFVKNTSHLLYNLNFYPMLSINAEHTSPQSRYFTRAETYILMLQASATKGEGLDESMEWLSNTLHNKK